MSKDTLTLASEFPASSHENWMALVEKVLKGADFEKTLVTPTYDRLKIQPLYTELDNHPTAPGVFPYTRSVNGTANAWAVMQSYAHPDLSHSNRLILDDLAKGVTRIQLVMSDAVRGGETALDNTGFMGKGLECYSVADLDCLLEGVKLELVPVELQAGAAFLEYACAYLALCLNQGLEHGKIRASLGADPCGALAEFGKLPGSAEHMLERMSELTVDCAKHYPNVQAVSVNTSVYHNAGASHAQEIAIALATGVEYLRALTAAGLDISAACRQIIFTVTTDTEFFQNVAKLRSLRQLWAQVCHLCGADEAAAKIKLQAVSSFRMLSQRDPWVNMLRSTIASCAGALGGAESIIASAYDQALGHPSTLGRRISRNTQLLLQDESSVHRIVDPAGGSYFIEQNTVELSTVAWNFFQSIEGRGGMMAALLDGSLQSDIDSVHDERLKNIARRQEPLTGLSEFANLAEADVTADQADTQSSREKAIERLNRRVYQADEELSVKNPQSLCNAMQQGASVFDLGHKIAGDECNARALKTRRLGAQFEALRDASDSFVQNHGKRPAVYVLTLGTAAQFNARAGFVKNFFAAGGIDVVLSRTTTDPDSAAREWAKTQLPIAVLCSNDSLYEQHGAEYIRALKESGLAKLYIAGKALSEHVDAQLHVQSNTLEILQSVHRILGVS